jgi:hypothetical protein
LVRFHAAQTRCADVDAEEYDKEYAFTTAEECAAAIVDAGYRYF